MRSALKMAAASAMVAVGMSGAAEAKSFTGNWDGNAEWFSTLVFLDNGKLLYCFRNECHTTTYHGAERGTVRFNWDDAYFTMKWQGDGYRATRKASGRWNSAFLD